MNIICGVDEAGRGPLAGDVFAAACILPKNYELPYGLHLGDSKKISAKKRELLFDWLTNNNDVVCGVARASVEEIDNINILQASMLAMQRAIHNVCAIKMPDLIQVDGNKSPKIDYAINCESIIKGDDLIQEISAASILAKVARDKYMLDMHNLYPEYEFNKHMGYPTALHRQKIKEYGISPIHRKSFAPVKALLMNKIIGNHFV
jgi:ribonuclease HII